MKVHTNTLTRDDVAEAAAAAGVTVISLTEHRSQSRDHAFNLILSGSGRSGGQYGNASAKSATWDEWGIVLAELFRRDPSVRIAKVYESEAAFHWITADRYRTLKPSDSHVQHRWAAREFVVTGSYSVAHCKCGAAVRTPRSGYTVEDLLDN